jgi:hypothetical protein
MGLVHGTRGGARWAGNPTALGYVVTVSSLALFLA